MRMVWKGIESTFRDAGKRQSEQSSAQLRQRITSMLLMLKALTPKDTGFASSRWRITGYFPRYRLENDADYIEHLNEGSSKQAPAFFVESVALRFGKPFGKITTVVPS